MKRTPALVSCAWLAAACSMPAWSETPQTWLRIELRDQVAVPPAGVRLADIALLTSPDLGLLRRALAIPLGQAPRLGDTALLDRERLGDWLRRHTGLRPGQIDWRGARQTAIATAAQDLAGEEVVAHAQSALAGHLRSLARQKGMDLVRLDIDPVAVPHALRIAAGARRLQVRPLHAGAMGPRMLVWVDVLVQEHHVRAIPVRFEVAAFARLPVASHAMPAGAPVQADGVQLREVDVAAMPGVFAAAPGDAGAAVLRHAVRAGEVVSADRLQARPAVSRGEWVRLVTRQGALSLESRVEVLQDGLPGQVVRARPAHASGALSARVVGRGQLELLP